PYTMEQYYRCFINIYWDDADTPAVHLPVASFFGGGGEHSWPTAMDLPARKLETLFFGYDGGSQSFYSYWPMPYWKNARIEIQNNTQLDIENADIGITYTSQLYPNDSCGYFFAKRTVDDKRSSTQPFGTAFREKGYGHVVGMTFYSDGYDMDGDEFSYIDGSRTPQIHGDGTEDDHNQGWGGSNFQEPLWGGLLNGYQGAYRIYMNDCYIFYDEIKINYEFERLAGLTAPLTDVTIFYYKNTGKGILNLTDEIDIANLTSEKKHQYAARGFKRSNISSGYDSYSKQNAYDTLTDNGNTINGSSEFVVNINPSNNGIKIRRRLDRFSERRQSVEVFIDGIKVKERPWYTLYPLSVTSQTAWADADFEIPSHYTRGKNKIRVKLTGTRFNEFYYWIYSYN
ncbi:MAG: DUF2961 domain-containing protein, partial [Chitinophagaceae bacterium]|nr:DUF2961 domain-containing protein [Chitinophagaceae bacterium]